MHKDIIEKYSIKYRCLLLESTHHILHNVIVGTKLSWGLGLMPIVISENNLSSDFRVKLVCHFAYVVVKCGVDTLYLPMLPKPPIQTWQAALGLLTHQSYGDSSSILGVWCA